ncbi:hypothetical protein VQ056_06380 [Paenibacillus sp. JTLBN-2024]
MSAITATDGISRSGFNQPSNTANIQNYRIMVVKTKDAGSFNLNTANNAASANYTTVNKTNGSTITTTLSSGARDTSGEYIKNGVSYTIFVLSVAKRQQRLEPAFRGFAVVCAGIESDRRSCRYQRAGRWQLRRRPRSERAV